MDTYKLSDKERDRYQRQIILPDFGEEAQIKLKNASVLVIGAGGLASPLLKYLCSTGVGRIGIMDGDIVEVSNLQRQIMYDESDEGQYKVEVSAQKLKEQNPNITIDCFNYRLTKDNAVALFKKYDLIIDACDNFETRYIICRAAQKADKAWIFASVFEYGGQVSVFNYRTKTQYSDLYPEAPDQIPLTDGKKIGVLPVVPGLIGLIQATEAIKIITGIGKILDGELLLYNAMDLSSQKLKIGKQG
ncbi:adenylyltransferase/sulfurtransferase [Ancylomarina subtilis]|uniref:Adenylyltransferase/sulfurtransferase n=1 Tax=Ancylomarina subtilis TaxID=1639035 RepID=A0A4V2FS88_9BACT|nr:HesA/MoeB/ThiF family protein [Ancylomarina subtilis]RZT93409.1 adenylyltransferase/sulfurtransferase [Ancylomarina subtilis]